MTKKGFTLIELLTVIVVLAVLLAITVPSVRTYISNSYAQSYELDLKAMEEAAKAYVIDEKIKFEEVERKIILINTLVEAGFLDPVIDPQSKEQCEGYVIVDRNYRKYTYKAYLRCGTNYVSDRYGYTDNVFPEIFILGDNPATIEVGDNYVDAGATASDNIDGDITSNILTTGEVNPNEIGTYTITYSVTDSSNNTTTKERIVNVIDTTAPNISFGTNGNSTWAKTRSTTVTVSDIGGVNTSSLKYLWNTSTNTPSEGLFSTTFISGGTINSPAGVTGGYYLWILAKDTQGNTIISRTNVFNLDNTGPSVPSTNFNGYVLGTWTAGNINLNLSSTDDLSSIQKYQWSSDGATWYDMTSNWLYDYDTDQSTRFRAVDNAGNVSDPTSPCSIKRDATAPSVPTSEVRYGSSTGTIRANNDDSWAKQTLWWGNFSATDATSGIKRYEFSHNCTGAVTGTLNASYTYTNHNYTFCIRAVDNAGNTSAWTTETYIKADTIAPTITISGSNPVYISLGGIYTDAGATASDATSGVGNVIPTGTVNVNVIGTYYIYYNVVDNAGNAAVQVERSVIVSDPFEEHRAYMGTFTSTIVFEPSYNVLFPRIYALKAGGGVMIYQPDYPWTWYLSGAYSGYAMSNITGAKAITGYGATQVLAITENNAVIQYTCPKETATCTSSAMAGFGTNVLQLATTAVYERTYSATFPRIYALKADGSVMIYQPDYPWTWYLSDAYSGYVTTNITGAKAITGYGATQVLGITENNEVVQYTCPRNTATCTSSAMAGFGTNVLQLATTAVYERTYSATFPRIYALKADGSVMIYQPDYPWTWYLSGAYSGYVTTNITGAKAITGYSGTQVLVMTENNEVVQYTCPKETATCTSSAMTGFGTIGR